MRAAVRSDGGGDAKAGNPVVDEGGGAVVGGGGGKGNGFWPAGSAVYYGEKVGVVGRGG